MLLCDKSSEESILVNSLKNILFLIFLTLSYFSLHLPREVIDTVVLLKTVKRDLWELERLSTQAFTEEAWKELNP